MMDYDRWLVSVPGEITSDPLWNVKAYRLALYVAELGWEDMKMLTTDKRLLGLSDQLYRALGSISANIAEGYSRSTGMDRARFYEYALGSAQESRDWYYKGRRKLGDKIVNKRLEILSQIIRLLLVTIPKERATSIREIKEEYERSDY
jgi:four helix bundle protein